MDAVGPRRVLRPSARMTRAILASHAAVANADAADRGQLRILNAEPDEDRRLRPSATEG